MIEGDYIHRVTVTGEHFSKVYRPVEARYAVLFSFQMGVLKVLETKQKNYQLKKAKCIG